MSIEYIKPTEILIARAYQITIDKSLPEAPSVTLYYTNGREELGRVEVTPSEIVDQGILTIEQIGTLESILRTLCDAKSPVVEVVTPVEEVVIPVVEEIVLI